MTLNGIDVQRWQNTIDFNKLKNNDRVQFAIIKAGGSDNGCYTDKKFEANYAGFKSIGVPVGAYYFVGPGFISANDGLADAKRFANILNGKQFEMPVYVDVEANFQAGKSAVTDAVIAFCEYMEQQGYFVGVYGSDIATFVNKVDLSRLTKYTLWVARYRADKYKRGDQQGNDIEPKYVKNYGIWQYAQKYRYDETKIPGIPGEDLDRNRCYVDFPTIIKSGGFNGFSKSDCDDKPEVVLRDVTLKQMSQGDVDKAVSLAKQLGVDYTIS